MVVLNPCVTTQPIRAMKSLFTAQYHWKKPPIFV